MKDPSETPPVDEAVEPAPSEAREPGETPTTDGDVVTEAPAPQEVASSVEEGERAPTAGSTPAAAAPEAPSRPVRETPNRVKPRDIALTVLSLLGLAALHHHDGHLRVGVPLGIALTFVAALGVLGLLGDSPLDLRGDEATPADPGRPWYLREGWWVILFSGALYIPMAGAYGLWDPWETHYSEVAREILSRDDWITTWWGQEGWFMSKPVLIFWMSALGMGLGSTFGLRIAADSGPQFQEWCIRLPIVLLAMGALFGLYRAVAAVWGKRAGVLVAMVLATMPHWFFLAHQAMTDMPFVAPLTLAIAALMRAVTVGDGGVTPHRVRFLGLPLRVSLWHLTVGAMLVTWLPQLSYLFTRPMVVSCPEDARMQQCTEMLRLNRIGMSQFPVETYFYGSFGNSADTLASSVPGSPQWERLASVVPFFPSAVQALVWLVLGAVALWLLRRVRRARDLYFVLVFFWCAISTMGKGPAGLAIPVAVAGTWLVVSGEWRLLRHARLLTGLLVFLVVGMPWYIAIVGRLGNEFIDRFVVHDIINRTVVGVHGDTGSVRYFLWQLGYAMFPWSGLVPVAVLGWRQVVPGDATPEQRHVARIGMLWFLSAFVLFSAMITKFHHYIFPAVPGAAVLVGLLLDRMLGAHTLRHARNPAGSLAALGAGITSAVLGVANFRGSPRGAIPHTATELPPGSPGLGAVLVLLGVGLVVLVVALAGRRHARACRNTRRTSTRAWPWRTRRAWRRVLLRRRSHGRSPRPGRGRVARALREDLARRDGPRRRGGGGLRRARPDVCRGEGHPPRYQRLLQLFTYQYERMWPTESFDYYPIMVGFGVVTAAVSAALAVHRWRAHAVRAMVALAAIWCAWALDFYMVDVCAALVAAHDLRALLPHAAAAGRRRADACADWRARTSAGGRCAMLDCVPFCSNHARQWMENHRGQRVFFVTERTHGSSIMSHVRATGGTARELTDAWDQGEFVLSALEATVGAGTAR
ncbi:MAG: glycosyltransferase family 39 protein [Polyangiales bacterium]